MKVFGSLKQKVLMKWETERMEEQPSNLTLKKFLPQQDILGHHNCVAFITHAGYLSFEESLCHRVPMLATPICYDQFDNAAEIESLGVGRSVKFTDITENNLKQALVEVLDNPTIKNQSETIGAALSPWKEMLDPVSRAVWWVEHVTDNPGVYSLNSFYAKTPTLLQNKSE